MNDSQRVSILSEALPYIQSFSGRKIVIKYGGSVMENDNLKNAFFISSVTGFNIESLCRKVNGMINNDKEKDLFHLGFH